MRKCIYCGKPLKINLGAEHMRCALRHPLLSLQGWFWFLLRNDTKRLEAEEKVRQKAKGEHK